MGRIEIISAGAGSGKTTRLAELLLDEVSSGRVRPQALLATTFTIKAAAELEHRVRVRLLSQGQVNVALALQGARLGTVNAVCGRLVSDYAFELGLSPDLQVLDERSSQRVLRHCLSQVVCEEEAEELEALSQQMPELSWPDEVKRIVDLARSNGIEPESLSDCARRSIGGLAPLFASPLQTRQGPELERALRQALERFVLEAEARRTGDATKVTRKAVERCRAAQGRLAAGLPLPWCDWLALSALETGKKSDALAEPVRAAAAEHDAHPRLRADIDRAVELVFSLAGRVLSAYQSEKRARGALDFVDQEVLALGLLDRSEVRAALGEELDLVLVDEFQDTSPLQLALFLKLAQVAPRSIWVGDQKQAIYGFRGADPALMDAAIEQLLEGREPETLSRSWRSRPELVRLTSELFAPPFGQQGLPRSRVVLVPGRQEEPTGLGEIVESWRLEAKNKELEALALAEGVRRLLDEGEAQRVQPSDLAVLCRTNDDCSTVAQALESVGLGVILPRPGLLGTLEAQVALAGLRLFIDPRDRLAAAELTRILLHPTDGDGWLAAVLQLANVEDAPSAAVPFLARLCELRESFPAAGGVAALDASFEALALHDLCLRWGSAPVRLANLDRLRAHAVEYEAVCVAEERGATPAGLVAHLESLEAEGQDSQAVCSGSEAVVVNTWHGAKGLEWPIVVLHGLSHDKSPQALGVHVVTDRAELDLAAPLAGRWLRYWPNPYRATQNKAAFHRRLEASAATAAARSRQSRELLRLLYVGWTRARDRIVLAGSEPPVALSMLQPLLAGSSFWPPASDLFRERSFSPGVPVERVAESGWGPPARAQAAHPPATQPCAPLHGEGRVGAPERIGARVAIQGAPEMAVLGQAVHGFLAADRPELSLDRRIELAVGLLAHWELENALSKEALLAMGEALRGWANRRAPGAAWHREWPLHYRQPNGTLLRGTADLLLETEAGFWIVDHKSYPGSVPQALSRAASHAGQLDAYARAVAAATRKPILGCAIHLPISGLIVPVELKG